MAQKGFKGLTEASFRRRVLPTPERFDNAKKYIFRFYIIYSSSSISTATADAVEAPAPPTATVVVGAVAVGT